MLHCCFAVKWNQCGIERSFGRCGGLRRAATAHSPSAGGESAQGCLQEVGTIDPRRHTLQGSHGRQRRACWGSGGGSAGAMLLEGSSTDVDLFHAATAASSQMMNKKHSGRNASLARKSARLQHMIHKQHCYCSLWCGIAQCSSKCERNLQLARNEGREVSANKAVETRGSRAASMPAPPVPDWTSSCRR